MPFYWLVLGILCVWRITHLLQAEDGPWDLSARLRAGAGEGFWGRLLDCFHCLSLWVAAPFAAWLARTAGEGLLLWLALSAGAILLQRLVGSEEDVPATLLPEREVPPAPYREEEGEL